MTLAGVVSAQRPGAAPATVSACILRRHQPASTAAIGRRCPVLSCPLAQGCVTVPSSFKSTPDCLPSLSHLAYSPQLLTTAPINSSLWPRVPLELSSSTIRAIDPGLSSHSAFRTAPESYHGGMGVGSEPTAPELPERAVTDAKA